MTVVAIPTGVQPETILKQAGSEEPDTVEQLVLDYDEEILFSTKKEPDPPDGANKLGSQHLRDFAWEVKRKLRGVRVVPEESNYNKQYYLLDENPCPYVLGWLGYRDFTDSDNYNEAKYGVWSKRIVNKRYKWGSKKHLLTSANMKIALRNVARSIRLYTPAEIATFSYSQYTNGLNNSDYASREEENDLWRKVKNSDSLKPELLDLLGAHTFADTQIEEHLMGIKSRMDDRQEVERNSGTKLALVVASDPNKVMVAHLSPSGYKFSVPSCYTCTMGELPSEIRSSLAVLSMVDQGTFIEGTGIKVVEDVYYVRY